jgi:hypothetical protein
MVTAWPRNLPGPGTAAQMLADRITALSGGRIEVELFAAGEIVPGNQVFDAVAEGTAELYHAVPAYWGSKSKGILLFGSQPFGLRADEQVGWLLHGGGQALYDEMYARFGLKPFLCGNSGPQWAGWFRNEINSSTTCAACATAPPASPRRCAAKLGMAVQAMSGPAMFQALQSGTIDAGEFIGPWSDSALGFHQVAKNYYWPGVGEPSSAEECAHQPRRLREPAGRPQAGRRLPPASRSTTRCGPNTPPSTPRRCAARCRARRAGAQAARRRDRRHGQRRRRGHDELREDSDELVRRIVESFLDYRTLMANTCPMPTTAR